VHLYGQAAAMDELQAIAEKHGLALFEDAAQAHGARFGGPRVGTFGTFAMFSLYPTKNMTSGEGGMVACEEDVARRVRLLRNQGMERQYANELVGFNARMTDVHAAIGRVQLTKVSDWTRRRRSNASYLDRYLEGVVTPPVREGSTHVYHQYTIRLEGASPAERDRVVTAMREEHQVGSGVYYPIPNHRLASLEHFAPGLELPVTERAAAEVISLPVHPSLETRDLERIVEAVNSTVKAGA
jgi:perosamine synthetase